MLMKNITLLQKKKLKKENSTVLGLVPFPKSIDSSYDKVLGDVLKDAHKSVQELVPSILAYVQDYNVTNKLFDSVNGDYGTINDYMEGLFSDTIDEYNSRTDTYTTIASDFVEGVNDYSQGKLIKMITSKYKNTTPAEVILKEVQNTFVSNAVVKGISTNTKLIKSIPNQYLNQVQDILTEKFSTLVGLPSTDTKSLIQHLVDGRLEVGESRVKIIARDQTHKVVADFNNARYTSYGVVKGIWKVADTSNRLRESHRLLADQEYVINVGIQSGSKYIKPAEEVLCRCDVIPIIPEGTFK